MGIYIPSLKLTAPENRPGPIKHGDWLGMNTPQWYYQLVRPCPHHQNFISTSLILPEIADVTKTCLMWYEMRHVESTKRMPFFRGQRCQTSSTPHSEFLERKTRYFLGSCVTFHNAHSAAFPTTLGGKKLIPGPQIVYLHFGSPWFETVSNGPRWLYQDQLWCVQNAVSDRQNVWADLSQRMFGEVFGIKMREVEGGISQNRLWLDSKCLERKKKTKASRFWQTNFKCISKKALDDGLTEHDLPTLKSPEAFVSNCLQCK